MISKIESKQLKGMAVLAMIILHLFPNNGQGYTSLLYLFGIPVTYFIGTASGFCTSTYLLVSGYGMYIRYLECSKNYFEYYKKTVKSIFRLLCNCWCVLSIYAIALITTGNAAKLGRLSEN